MLVAGVLKVDRKVHVCRKSSLSSSISPAETARFYRALNMLGTNFSLMVKLFPGRDRIDLKRKFKSEEKTNPSLVDKIIATQIPFDISQFLDEEGKPWYRFAFS